MWKKHECQQPRTEVMCKKVLTQENDGMCVEASMQESDEICMEEPPQENDGICMETLKQESNAMNMKVSVQSGKTMFAGESLQNGKLSGQVEIIMGMFAFLMVLFAIIFGLKFSQFMITGAYVEDALAASNLASALIDIEEYGKSYTICVREPEDAFVMYRDALSVNLQLDEEGNSFQRELLEGPVKILSYIVYNVKGSQVEIFSFDGNGSLIAAETGYVGLVRTPDGVTVETTTIYSKVEFSVQGIGEQEITVRKEKSVDIKREDNE